MIFNKTTLALGIASALVLASCSGGSDDSTPSATGTTTVTGTSTSTETITATATATETETATETITATSTTTETETTSAPIVNAGNNVSAITDEAFMLSGSATDSDSAADDLTYTWMINNQSYSGESVSVTLNASGIYPATLTVSDGENTSTSQVVVIVADAIAPPVEGTIAPIVDAGGNLTVTEGEEFTLSGSASDADTADEDLIYIWSVNDSVYSGSSVNVTLNTADVYVATLTVFDGKNSSTDSIAVTVSQASEVTNTAPTISVDIEFANAMLMVSATDTETPNDLTYAWSVGGVDATGNTSSIDSSSYIDSGEQVVVVTVTDADGMTATSSVTIDFGTALAVEIVIDPNDPAILIIDQYDGDIPLDQKVIGNSSAQLQTDGNPFADAYFYLNPDISTMMDYSIDKVSDDTLIQKMKYIQKQPSAIWMDSIATITQAGGDGTRITLLGHLEAALMQQAYYKQADGAISPMTVVIIIYNLPDRDCAAFASNGKLLQVGKSGVNYKPEQNLGLGYEKYRDEYIAPIKAAFSDPRYASLRIVAMLEPDSFPNMITNTNEGGLNPLLGPEHASLESGGYCDDILNFNNDTVVPPVDGEGNTDNPNLGLYADSLRLAIKEMHDASLVSNNIYTYMDIGHAGWLGWDKPSDVSEHYPGYEDERYKDGIPDYLQTNMKRGVRYFKQLVDGADGKLDGKGMEWVRGFASNTAVYTPTEEPLI
ncbi:MAG: glycoside hydrolase family 6 protein, partial [Pseudomonadales bacterium]|nr:glycoside hydrolase family 6 protein [Pseudomonadales bacterium]